MKIFDQKDIENLHHLYRINLINSCSGYKSANLIGTQSKDGQTNLAVFSSVMHLGSNPPLIGFILRPDNVPRHTYENIMETGVYTVNHVFKDIQLDNSTILLHNKGKSYITPKDCTLTDIFFINTDKPIDDQGQNNKKTNIKKELKYTMESFFNPENK